MFKRTPTRFLACVTRKIMGTPARRENTGKDQLCEEDREVMLGGGGTVDTSESTKWRCAVCTVTVLVWSPESPPGFMSESLEKLGASDSNLESLHDSSQRSQLQTGVK